MSVLLFPTKPTHHAAAAAQIATVIANGWADRALPLVDVARELLGLDDTAFSARVMAMQTPGGAALLVELADELQTAARDLEVLYRAFYLVRVRLSAGMTALQHAQALS